MRVLYISHNGMAEGLGQAQVLPYLRGLVRRGFEIELVSYEVPTTTREARTALATQLEGDGIRWSPLERTLGGSFPVKVAEAMRGFTRVARAARARRPDIVHGRSYFPTAIADLVATVFPRAKVVFDCRGMLGDEYVDAGYWTRDRLEYRALKRYEARIFRRADGVVVLTEALRKWILERRWLGTHTSIDAIPCCVDLEKFRFDEAARERIRAELGFEDRLVLVYSGSLGSWYREEDIARFAKIVKERSARPIGVLVATASPPHELVERLSAHGIGGADVVVRRVPPAEMPGVLSAADVGISFIKSCFSKMGSSPTKVAEYLASGLPVVLNGDIGDQADLRAERDGCVVIDGFDDGQLEVAATRALELATAPLAQRVSSTRRIAEERFDLERVGVARYERLYRAVAGGG